MLLYFSAQLGSESTTSSPIMEPDETSVSTEATVANALNDEKSTNADTTAAERTTNQPTVASGLSERVTTKTPEGANSPTEKASTNKPAEPRDEGTTNRPEGTTLATEKEVTNKHAGVTTEEEDASAPNSRETTEGPSRRVGML